MSIFDRHKRHPDRIQTRWRALAGQKRSEMCLRISGIDRINRPGAHRPITQCNANKEITRYDNEEEIRTNNRRTHINCVCAVAIDTRKRNRRDLCRSRRMSHKSLSGREKEKKHPFTSFRTIYVARARRNIINVIIILLLLSGCEKDWGK